MKIIAAGILGLVVGIPLAYAVDATHGKLQYLTLLSCLIFCLGGVALILLGLFKLVTGLVRRA